MYDAEKRMQEIMEAPQIAAAEKSKLYSDQVVFAELNRSLTFKNMMENHRLPIKKCYYGDHTKQYMQTSGKFCRATSLIIL